MTCSWHNKICFFLVPCHTCPISEFHMRETVTPLAFSNLLVIAAGCIPLVETSPLKYTPMECNALFTGYHKPPKLKINWSVQADKFREATRFFFNSFPRQRIAEEGQQSSSHGQSCRELPQLRQPGLHYILPFYPEVNIKNVNNNI